MRGRTLLLFLIALVLAGGTAVLVRSRLETTKSTMATFPTPAPVPRKSVLVARVAIGRGQILKAADFGWQPWPQEGVTQAYIVKGREPAAAFAGRVALQAFVVGEPIIKSQIIAPGDRGFLAAVLHPGMRAVSVPVNASSGIAGFILPGDRVDVLITHSLPVAGAGGQQLERKAAETILHNVRVIAIDQRLESKRGEAMPAHTVTLEVTPKQSQILALASDLGQLSLSLRSLVVQNDQTSSDGKSVAAAEGFTLDSDVSRLIADDQVTIIRGGNTSTNAADAVSAVRGN
jgi:pilus assembly protein CpaB